MSKNVLIDEHASLILDCEVTISSPGTHKRARKILYFNYFKELFIHFNGTLMIKNKFDKYVWENIKAILKETAPLELKETIGFISRFAIIIGNSLKWNPRLIKRFLNAFEIRSCLLAQSGVVDNLYPKVRQRLTLI